MGCVMTLYTVTVDAVQLSANTVQTLWQVQAAATKRVRVVEWGISFDGVSASAVPARVELLRQSSTGTSSAYTPNKVDESDVAALASALTAFTVEPGVGAVLQQFRVTPNGGLLVLQYPFGREVQVGVGNRIGCRVLAADAVKATSYVVFEE